MTEEDLVNLKVKVDAILTNQLVFVPRILVLENALVQLAKRLAQSTLSPANEMESFVGDIRAMSLSSLQQLNVDDPQLAFQVEAAADRLGQLLLGAVEASQPRSSNN